ncbi:biopolymer transport protein ExbD/TolR [Kordia periserrulae]|uniref:Biopolymer transport protein ExbD/TolR n=1 Tax=Kordia periserrulae TaxID=701523 RepID=A0A2T6BRU3_9FLAO|nr:biopolymer transporter ExbD [Kordia periserrulae]PTX58764.1 biopolymer transport protein ExbD/TolR [Kordia periserrulae]
MRINIKSLLILGLLFAFTAAFGQDKTLETETAFMNCVYEALPDKGAKFKEVLDTAEKKLIKIKYLKDAKGESYVEIYKDIRNMFSPELKDLGVATYMAEIQGQLSNLETSKCMEAVFGSPKFENSKLSKMLVLIQSIAKYEDGETLTNDILKIVKPEDFTHDYYRMTTFTMLEAMNQVDDSGINFELPDKDEEEFTEEELKNAFKIEIFEDQKVTLNNEEVAIDAIKSKVKKYLKKNKAESILIFKSDRAANYKNFMTIQSQIVTAFEEVREELAQEKYKTPFESLTESQKEEIKNIYPLRIKEDYEE